MTEQAGCPDRVFSAASVAYLSIPVQRDTAELAAYPLVFLLIPLVSPNLLLTSDVFHDVPVVWYTVIIKLDEETAGEFRAVSASRYACCGHGTPSYFALVTKRAAGTLAETAFTVDPFYRNVETFGKCLENTVCVLALRVMPHAIQGTASAV